MKRLFKNFSILFLFLIVTNYLFADIKGVEKVSKNSPNWARAENIFLNMDETAFGGFFFENEKHLSNFSKEQFFPFVDRYGQFVHSDWGGKIYSDSDFQKAINIERKFDKFLQTLENVGQRKLDSYQGCVCERVNFGQSRRFRLAKYNGKWFFVTPSGNLFWSLGVNAIGGANGTRVTGREHYFSSDARLTDSRYQERLPFDKTRSVFFRFYDRNIDIKYGSSKERALMTQVERFSKWGFNSMGVWANKDIASKVDSPYFALSEYPRCEMIRCANMRESLPDFFCESFKKSVQKNLQKLEADFANPKCIGVFVGYKMFWQNKTRLANLPRAIMSAECAQPVKSRFLQVLREKYGDVGKLNSVWNSNYEKWDDFLEVRDFFPETEVARVDFENFTLVYIEQFFKVCSDAIKARDSEMLFLGSRIPTDAHELVLVATSRHCDAVSLANYPKDASKLKLSASAEDKPILVCEFNFCAQDRGVFGGGYSPVKSTGSASRNLEKFLQDSLENPAIVGVHWMRWIDAPTSAKHNGENTASGLVDICDTPIYQLISVFKEVSAKIYEKRLNN